MPRAFLIVIDSVGIGGAPDAGQFFNGKVPDAGANTVGHIAQTVGLATPTLDALGLRHALHLASGLEIGMDAPPIGSWGAATEVSRGKDTPSGHWELAGVPVPWEWHVFADTQPAFPDDLTKLICRAAGTDGILGNKHASGTAIIAEEGAAHLITGWPICYTSADSVVQIAAHEDHFGLERLYQLCRDISAHLHAMKVGRVIARPFVGQDAGSFQRTENRKDFAIAPPSPTICDDVHDAGRMVYAVGKIGDIFSMRGIDDLRKGRDVVLMGHLSDLAAEAVNESLIFANLVEFDSTFGHRRNVQGYRDHLHWFDAALAGLLLQLRADDILIVTADHGNDPTWVGTDHTRERVPVLVHGLGAKALGHLRFVDVAATIAHYLDVPYRGEGKSFHVV